MKKIELLDQKTIDSIAAGEVVERPASVAKELIENAIDAGADAITVEIKNGGKTFLRVTDNGCGIDKDEIRLAFLRHATSKLKDISELSYIDSLGFRGEALSSIAAVSQTELITRTRDDITGVRYRIEGGEEKELEMIGAPYGTTFIMRNLFFNTPAREKFLKSSVTEGNAVTSYMEQLSLSHPEISFNFISDGKQRLFTSGSGDLLQCIYQIYGRDITKQLIKIQYNSEIVSIDGYLGKSDISRGNRNFENYFVNGRYVHDKILSSAIEEAYKGHLMQHKYPFTLLNFTIDKEKVDVNVHPSKMEVRFSSQAEIYEEVRSAISLALMKREEIPSAYIETEKKEKFDDLLLDTNDDFKDEKRERSEECQKVPEELSEKKEEHLGKLEEQIPNEITKKAPEAFENKRREASHSYYRAIPQTELVREKQLSIFDDAKANEEIHFRIIGQVFDTYILVEYKDKFYMIDQHAAHEKVMFEKYMKEYKEHKISTQYLLPAKLISLTASENTLFSEHLDDFADMGYEIEHFEGREWRITGVPSNLYVSNVDDMFKEILDGLSESGLKSDLVREKIASKSCKAAVKGKSRLSDEEIKALVKDLLSLTDPYHCPHGRPTMISMTRYEMDKKFKRII